MAEALAEFIVAGDEVAVERFFATEKRPPNRGICHYDFKEQTRLYDTFATLAVKAKSAKILQLVIQNGYDLNESDDMSDSPLLIAFKLREYSLMEQLIAGGANINALDKSSWPELVSAVQNGDLLAVKSLLSAAADRARATGEETSPSYSATSAAKT